MQTTTRASLCALALTLPIAIAGAAEPSGAEAPSSPIAQARPAPQQNPAVQPNDKPRPPAAGPPSRGLLVGCTTYDDVKTIRSLKGPVNDVALMHDLLVDRFHFDTGNIRRLTEGRTAADRPTRANIVREIEALIAQAQKDQRIVLFFAGHGCQQPDQNPPDANDPEPDGLDETFLPADVGPWEQQIQSVKNAIVDDEIAAWVKRLLAKGADLLVIFDSCHSGSAMRGFADEQPRHVEPEKLIPAEVLAQARDRGAASTASAPQEPPLDALDRGGWVALYAAQPDQLTVELTIKGATDARTQGLFTSALCRAICEGDTPSYRELIQRVRAGYLARGKFDPTPMIEGRDLDRRMLGAERGAISYFLERDGRGKWFIAAGQLHGLTQGSILAVRSPKAPASAAPLGYVQVTASGLARADVTACAYQEQPAAANLPIGGLCRPVYVDYGDMRLRVALDPEMPRGLAAEPPVAALRELANKPDAPLSVVADESAANWFLTPRGPADKPVWVLSPRSPSEQPRGLGVDLPPDEVPLSVDDPEKLEASFRAINRATNLLALSASLAGTAGGDGDGQVTLELLHTPKGAAAGSVVPVDRLPTFADGDHLQFRVTNNTLEPMDVTLLFVDSAFGITPVFPRGYGADNRLPAGQSWPSKLGKPALITADKTIGREHLVLIAVPAAGPPMSFTFLAQPTLAQARGDQARGGSPPSPFEKLLSTAAFGQGGTRGLEQQARTPVMETRSWVVRK